jgi:hypothetical protein
MISFLEAYTLYGRDSAAIAKACGIDESEAYNRMAAQADIEHGKLSVEARAWRDRNRDLCAFLFREARA